MIKEFRNSYKTQVTKKKTRICSPSILDFVEIVVSSIHFFDFYYFLSNQMEWYLGLVVVWSNTLLTFHAHLRHSSKYYRASCSCLSPLLDLNQFIAFIVSYRFTVSVCFSPLHLGKRRSTIEIIIMKNENYARNHYMILKL